jgi:hypothetical protein
MLRAGCPAPAASSSSTGAALACRAGGLRRCRCPLYLPMRDHWQEPVGKQPHCKSVFMLCAVHIYPSCCYSIQCMHEDYLQDVVHADNKYLRTSGLSWPPKVRPMGPNTSPRPLSPRCLRSGAASVRAASALCAQVATPRRSSRARRLLVLQVAGRAGAGALVDAKLCAWQREHCAMG